MFYTKILDTLSEDEAKQLTEILNRNEDAVYLAGAKRFERLKGEDGYFIIFLVSSGEPSDGMIQELITFARGLEAGFDAWYRPEPVTVTVGGVGMEQVDVVVGESGLV